MCPFNSTEVSEFVFHNLAVPSLEPDIAYDDNSCIHVISSLCPSNSVIPPFLNPNVCMYKCPPTPPIHLVTLE